MASLNLRKRGKEGRVRLEHIIWKMIRQGDKESPLKTLSVQPLRRLRAKIHVAAMSCLLDSNVSKGGLGHPKDL